MLRFVILILLCLLPAQAFSESTGVSVAVSIKPIHSLASNIMQGISEPHLVVSASGSPHGYNLRPSEIRMLEKADLIIWTGPELEAFLRKPLENSSTKQVVIRLLRDIPKLKILPAREGGTWEENSVNKDGHHDHGHIDPHVWLSPENARIIADNILTRLSTIDPDNRAAYKTNHSRLINRLIELESNIATEIIPLQQRRYIVFHDAYQYFEKTFGLKPVGALAVDPDRRPGAKRLSQLKKTIEGSAVECVFTEPQFEPRLVKVLIEGTSAQTAILDPLGADLPPGPELYFQLMNNMATALTGCLAEKER